MAEKIRGQICGLGQETQEQGMQLRADFLDHGLAGIGKSRLETLPQFPRWQWFGIARQR